MPLVFPLLITNYYQRNNYVPAVGRSLFTASRFDAGLFILKIKELSPANNTIYGYFLYGVDHLFYLLKRAKDLKSNLEEDPFLLLNSINRHHIFKVFTVYHFNKILLN